jgi:hypothetical protein
MAKMITSIHPRWLALASAMGLTLFTGAASAEAPPQPLCVDHAALGRLLADRHSEKPVAIGKSESGGVVEVYSSPSGETWTMVLAMPNGTACLVAAGEKWKSIMSQQIEGEPI